LGLFDGTMLVAGNMIGSGVFIVSADIARQVGSPGWLLAVWAIAGILTLIAAVSYGELAAMYPRAGGQYIYLREAFGPMLAFLYGWALFLVIQTEQLPRWQSPSHVSPASYGRRFPPRTWFSI
jgi:basic amino acid/polyamine antiporter, APA family